MQVILFFFLTTFSCGFAQEKNHPESADNNLLAADVKKLPSAEKSHVPEDGDGASVNVEEILRELNEERAKNRDLNQTISDILERMADMERDIIRNGEKIDQAQSSVVLRGTWCGYQNYWDAASSTITYDSLTFSDSNMEMTGTPLDINTGNYSHMCYYYLDFDICHISGIFTVPETGVWRMSFSMESRVYSDEDNIAYLSLNGEGVDESEHRTYSQSGVVQSTGGRQVTRELTAGDNIEIRATRMDGEYRRILFCAEYLPKM